MELIIGSINCSKDVISIREQKSFSGITNNVRTIGYILRLREGSRLFPFLAAVLASDFGEVSRSSLVPDVFLKTESLYVWGGGYRLERTLNNFTLLTVNTEWTVDFEFYYLS